ncbi:MAG: 4Fe-4S binding protein, partial [Actinobacteria bacterium]|nr:4Fe-4S binding protein [Actinomycetota bacterium]
MRKHGKKSGLRRVETWRWVVRLAFLAFFVLLTFRAAYPPIYAPPSNLFLRFDPLAGLFAVTAARSASVFFGYWPAWILLGLTLLSSRFFCGWICPLGTCFDVAGAIKPKFLKYYRPHGREMKALLEERRRGVEPRRIRVKYIILPAVLVLSLVGVNLLYLFSPLVVFNRGVYFILLPQVPVLLVVLLLLAFLYRPRFWCEEVCPLGALFSLVSMAGKRLRAAFSPLSVVKDPEVCISCGACYKNCPLGVDEPFTREESGRLRSADCTACGKCIDACPTEGALALNSFGVDISRSRGVKRSGRSTKRVKKSDAPAEATDRKLTVTRREFVASVGVGAVLAAGYGVGLKGTGTSEPLLRMPGAQDESAFLAACTRCVECVRACPTGCIKPMGIEDGFQKLWTPRFHPRTAPCTFDKCDQACARVCPSGAITRQAPEYVAIGTAHVNQSTCRSWKGRICVVCKERCRFNAIDIDEHRRPHVNTDRCNGCGACQSACPTEPASIQVFPAGWTTDWSSDGGGGGGGGGGG